MISCDVLNGVWRRPGHGQDARPVEGAARCADQTTHRGALQVCDSPLSFFSLSLFSLPLLSLLLVWLTRSLALICSAHSGTAGCVWARWRETASSDTAPPIWVRSCHSLFFRIYHNLLLCVCVLTVCVCVVIMCGAGRGNSDGAPDDLVRRLHSGRVRGKQTNQQPAII